MMMIDEKTTMTRKEVRAIAHAKRFSQFIDYSIQRLMSPDADATALMQAVKIADKSN